MKLGDAQNEFALRLYDWSRRDFLRELEEGCPLLSLIGLNDMRIAAFVIWNESLNSEQRRRLVIALTKHCHDNAAHLRGEVMTDEDQRWRRALYENTSHGVIELTLPPLSTADRDRADYRPLDADHCIETLLAAVPLHLGKITRRKSTVLCTKILGDWRIATEFKLLRRDEDLTFEYQFIRKDGGPVPGGHPAQGPFPRTLLFFYGLGFTTVRVPSFTDGERMAKVMPKLAEHFVRQADPLFEGLGIDD